MLYQDSPVDILFFSFDCHYRKKKKANVFFLMYRTYISVVESGGSKKNGTENRTGTDLLEPEPNRNRSSGNGTEPEPNRNRK
jgi:hypothetical protein